MRVRKFTGKSAGEALRKVKEELGPDALILSNRPVAGGVEITALSSEDAVVLSHPQPAVERAVPQAERSEVADIIDEIRTMRSMLEAQLAGFAWGDMAMRDPVKASAIKKMLGAGFSPKLSRQISDKMPPLKEEKAANEWIKTALVRHLQVSHPESDIIDRGGVFALVGPTGVGKTTTTAKLAARCVVRHGASKLALVTTDSYRIGAYEQLRIYGRILGVPVHSVKDAADLRLILHELSDKHLVLIDTIGMSQRDQKVIEQAAMLSRSDANVERILLLNATSSGETLEDVVRAYHGRDLSGCILTKVDEAINIGSALDVIMRNKLMLHFIANGQRVPEDLHTANAKYLMDRAFRSVKENSPYALEDVEFPLVMTGGIGA